MKDSYIPQYLDVPERYIFFTADEALVVVLPLVLLTSFSNFPIGLLGAGMALFLLRKVKQGGPLSRLLWRAYWLLPEGLLRLRATPPSHLRQLAG